MTPNRPYLLRALYDWIVDNGMTPYLLVDAEKDGVLVPRDYVDNGRIVLNVAPSAVQRLVLGNDINRFNKRSKRRIFIIADLNSSDIFYKVSEVGI